MFNTQIKLIFKAIDQQLERPEQVVSKFQTCFVLCHQLIFMRQSHVVLSGGLGSSKYVQDCILERYGPKGREKKILISRDP